MKKEEIYVFYPIRWLMQWSWPCHFAYLESLFIMFSKVSTLVEDEMYPKFLESSSQITNSTSRIAIIVRNPVSKCTFCLNLTNTTFYFFVIGSTFKTTLSPNVRIWNLWGIWFTHLFRMHLKVAIACTVWICGLSKLKLPYFCIGCPSATYPA